MKTLATAFILFLSLTAFSQKFDVPKDYEFKSKSDYPKYEKDIVAAAKWLEATDLDKETDKRKEVNAFVVAWVSGSPDVSIEINENLSKVYGENPQLLVLYMASYSRYWIEHKTSFTALAAVKAGFTSMMNVYKKDIEIKKSNQMDKIIEMNDEELTAYINNNILGGK